MIAITVLNRTIYDCDVFQKGPNMIAMLKFVLESRGYDFWINLAKQVFDDCKLIWSFLQGIAIIYSLIQNCDCNHI